MINNTSIIKDLLINLLKRNDLQISEIREEFVSAYSITIDSKEVARLSLETTSNRSKVNFSVKFTEYRHDTATFIVNYSRSPIEADYELLYLVGSKYKKQLKLEEQVMNQEPINNKFNTKWVKLKDFYININAISKISLSSVSYVEYVAIYTGDDKPELVETNYYNKWVKENNLDLPIFEEK